MNECCPVTRRCDPDVSNESTGHVDLVRESRRSRRLGWRFSRSQQTAGGRNSFLNEVRARCDSGFAPERTKKLKLARTPQVCQFSNRYPLIGGCIQALQRHCHTRRRRIAAPRLA